MGCPSSCSPRSPPSPVWSRSPRRPTPRTLTFGSAVDTTVRADHPNKGYSSLTTLTADNSPIENALLRFTVSGVGTDVVVGATLRLFVTGNPARP